MKKTLGVLLAAGLLAGCVNQSEVTPAQMQRIDAADKAVAEVLFKAGVDASTSYNVHPDGFVVLKFGRGVDRPLQFRIVDQLRADARISGVRIEYSGGSCPLKQG